MGSGRARRQEAATAELMATAVPLVWCYARGMTGDEAAARVVVHEVCRLARPAVGAPASTDQLLVRARLACRDEGPVDAGAEAAHGADEVSGDEHVSTDGTAPSGIRDELAAGLAALGDDEREALLLLDVLGLDEERAARITDLAPADLHDRRHRAHARLVARLVGGGR